MERIQPQVGAGQEEQEPPARAPEDERIAAILDRIQAIKPEYKQKEQRGEASNGVRRGAAASFDDQLLQQQKQLLRTPTKEVRQEGGDLLDMLFRDVLVPSLPADRREGGGRKPGGKTARSQGGGRSIENLVGGRSLKSQ